MILLGMVIGASSPLAFGDHHGQVPPGDGAFVALMVKASDPDTYIQMLKDNPAPFEAIGSTVAGACVTKTGADYPGPVSYTHLTLPTICSV